MACVAMLATRPPPKAASPSPKAASLPLPHQSSEPQRLADSVLLVCPMSLSALSLVAASLAAVKSSVGGLASSSVAAQHLLAGGSGAGLQGQWADFEAFANNVVKHDAKSIFGAYTATFPAAQVGGAAPAQDRDNDDSYHIESAKQLDEENGFVASDFVGSAGTRRVLQYSREHAKLRLLAQGAHLVKLASGGACDNDGCGSPHRVLSYSAHGDGVLLCSSCDRNRFYFTRGERFVWQDYGDRGVAVRLKANEFVRQTAPQVGPIDCAQHIEIKTVAMTAPINARCPKCTSPRVRACKVRERRVCVGERRHGVGSGVRVLPERVWWGGLSVEGGREGGVRGRRRGTSSGGARGSRARVT